MIQLIAGVAMIGAGFYLVATAKKRSDKKSDTLTERKPKATTAPEGTLKGKASETDSGDGGKRASHADGVGAGGEAPAAGTGEAPGPDDVSTVDETED
ncbi:MAG TPA: hypothetical protein ENJ79_07810 [Gammaproteobacteria bacterium]|nr:hypothetical protein [Gammaproteobacteria bacterium]